MKVALVYATGAGQTAKVAEVIAASVRENGHTVDVFNAGQSRFRLELGGYDAAIVGSPVRGGKHLPLIRQFIASHREFLATRPCSFFSVSLSASSDKGRPNAQAVVDAFLRELDWRPMTVALVAGALRYSTYNPLLRFVMQRIAKAQGGGVDWSRDYEYTDWDAVARFGREFAAAIERRAAA